MIVPRELIEFEYVLFIDTGDLTLTREIEMILFNSGTITDEQFTKSINNGGTAFIPFDESYKDDLKDILLDYDIDSKILKSRR